MDQCPNCKSRKLVKGTIKLARGPVVFAPKAQRFFSFSLRGGTRITGDALACLDCGFVSGFTSPTELQAFVQRHCHHPENE